MLRFWAGGARSRLGIIALMVALVVPGLAALQYKLSLVRNDRDIGHADEAAYVLMANSLIHGGGLNVNYVSFFFIPYDREITRREDHWPPFLSVTIAPFLAIFGNTPRAARIAPILIGTFGLPLMTAWLGLRYSRRTYVALLAGLLMMANSAMFNDSMRTMSDVATAMLVAGLAAALLTAREKPGWHIVAGLFAAACFYAKGSLLILIALYPLLAVLACGRGVLRSRWLHAGLAAAILCVSPWLISSYRLFGNPFHSTQNYVSSFFGVEALDPSLYKPYWGRDLPKIGDRWKGDPAKLGRRLALNREQMTRWTILGPSTTERAWAELGPVGSAAYRALTGSPKPVRGTPPTGGPPRGQPAATTSSGGSLPHRWEEPLTTLSGIAAVLFVTVLLLGGIARSIGPGSRPQLLGPTLALLLIMVPHWTFMVYMWKAIPRFSYPFLPLLAVIGCTGAGRLVELSLRFFSKRPSPCADGWASAVMAIAVLVLLIADGSGLRSLTAPRKRADAVTIDRPVTREPYPEIGEWIARNIPGAVVMARNPWELLYHAGPANKTVNVPFSSPADIFSIARYYRVTHYLSDAPRPGMELFVSGHHPGMKLLDGAPGRLFELDYAWLPDSGLSGAASP